jgi:hypothetical protein
MTSNIAICILTRQYNKEWATFLNEFTQYPTYMMCDKENIMCRPFELGQLFLIDPEECSRHKYTDSSTATIDKKMISWDKALFYFIHKCSLPYDYIWFIEDDVFFHSEKTIMNIDSKFPSTDLLTTFHDINHNGDAAVGWNHWYSVLHNIEYPWAHSLICACRLSRPLLQKIGEYVSTHNSLFFIEAMFNTIAMQNDLTIAHPIEIRHTVQYDNKIEDSDMNPFFLYHPVKDCTKHYYYRKIIKQMITQIL